MVTFLVLGHHPCPFVLNSTVLAIPNSTVRDRPSIQDVRKSVGKFVLDHSVGFLFCFVDQGNKPRAS